MARIADAYIALSGKKFVFATEDIPGMLNIPASCFLRPYNKKLKIMEPLRLKRIRQEMTAAAANNAIYHLWWHPHNFGKNMDKNFSNLENILDHYERLQKRNGMSSMNMKEIYERFKKA
jgi:hypothetical protein